VLELRCPGARARGPRQRLLPPALEAACLLCGSAGCRRWGSVLTPRVRPRRLRSKAAERPDGAAVRELCLR
jgi:hypothetical protein